MIPSDRKKIVILLYTLVEKLKELFPQTIVENFPLSLFDIGTSDNIIENNPSFKALKRTIMAYLFLLQLLFYNILSHKQESTYPLIHSKLLLSIQDLQKFFLQTIVHEPRYRPILGMKIIGLLSNEKLSNLQNIEILKSVIISIQEIPPEQFQYEVLGSLFHEILPKNVRRIFGSYYTLPESASLLAELAIDPKKANSINILDPSCGSGQLLLSAYQKIQNLTQITMDSANSNKKWNQDLISFTGIEIMPYVAQICLFNMILSEIPLTQFQIGITDATKLAKEKEIPSIPLLFQQEATNSVDQSFSLNKINLIVMNPPFTRQEMINKLKPSTTKTESSQNYKSNMINAIAQPPYEYFQDLLNEKQSLSSYFILIADKILEQKGTIAAVIPATLLRDEVNQAIREYIFQNYSIRFIVSRCDALNFSEDTTFRELLLIMEKHPPEKNSYISYIIINSFSNNIGLKIREQDATIVDNHVHTCEDFTIQKIRYIDLTPINLYGPIALKNPELWEMWQKIIELPRFNSNPILTDEGVRSRKFGKVPEMCIVQKLDSRTLFQFKSITYIGKNACIRFISDKGHEDIIPYSSLFSYVRNATNQKMDLEDLKEYIIWNIEDFPESQESEIPLFRIRRIVNNWIQLENKGKISQNIDDDESVKNILVNLNQQNLGLFQQLTSEFGPNEKILIKEAKTILTTGFSTYQANWKRYLSKKLCYLATIETFHIEAPHTYFFAYFAGENKRIFSSIFNNILSLDKDEAKINCLWLNSVLSFIQLYISQVPTGWFKIRQYVLHSLKILDIGLLSIREKNQLLKLFDEIGQIQFPCIWRQILSNIPAGQISKKIQDELCLFFRINAHELNQIQNNPFKPRHRLDQLILQCFYPKLSMSDLEQLQITLYRNLIQEILES